MGAQTLTSRAILGRLFLRLEQGATGWVDNLSFHVDSDQFQEEHRWLGMSPQMREWIGGRNAKGLREFGQIIKNLEFEATIEVKLRELRLDKTAQIMARIDGLGDRTNSHGAKLLSDLIIAGESTVCYDGQFFFDTDHVDGDSGAQSNDVTASAAAPAAPTVTEFVDAILASIQTMYGFLDDVGEPLNEMARDFLVMTPIPLWGRAQEAVSKSNLAGGETNVLTGLSANGAAVNIEVVANPRLTWTDKFATFRRDRGDGAAPFIRQEEHPLNVSAQAEGSPEEFSNKRHLYGVDWAGNYGYAFWQHANLTTFT